MQPDIVTDWHRLYGKSWKGAIEEDSFAHPAKFSRKLIRKIYDHAFEEGWLHIGDAVLDPFGGVALGAWPALVRDLRWVGVELEARFVLMGNRNIERWKALLRAGGYSYDDAYLYHGDSRYLSLLLGQRVNGCVSSPPYEGGCAHTGGDDPHPEHIQGGTYHGVGIHRAISSPPYNLPMSQDHSGRGGGTRGTTPSEKGAFAKYGSSPGQLEGLPMGDFEAVVSSPPYEGSLDHAPGNKNWDESPTETQALHGNKGYSGNILKQTDYGASEGQLGTMPAGQFEAAVSSPPFENAIGSADPEKRGGLYRDPKRANDLNLTGEYGETAGQLGTERGETFWAAARQVLEQTYQVLVPGAHALWVVKDFVRKGERVPFSRQWAELCIACGFEWLHEHRCWLVEDRGTQLGFFEDRPIVKENKSFFRRLAEKNGAPPIDWESVLCFRRL